ncbi:MAG: bifunctional adenosylcobinamide kinase/adenosylcobinamide-phosphate guanylyltransferase [Dehalococcoidia bacterium]
MGELILVTGGARSGKSRFAEHVAAETAARDQCGVTYIATLTPGDKEMRARVAAHQARRPASWRTVEAVDDLPAAVRAVPSEDCILLDCLAVWLAGRLLALGEDDPDIAAVTRLDASIADAVAALIEAAASRPGTTIVVTNEVGEGVVPPSALGRAYRDLLGRANQQASQAAARAWLLVAGRPLPLPPPFEA